MADLRPAQLQLFGACITVADISYLGNDEFETNQSYAGGDPALALSYVRTLLSPSAQAATSAMPQVTASSTATGRFMLLFN